MKTQLSKLFPASSVPWRRRRSLVPVASKGELFFSSKLLYLTSTVEMGHPGIKANLKAVQGDLFLLEKYIFFVSKSPLLVEISDIHQIVFSRVGAGMGAAAARTFDLKIITKSGPEHNFTSVNKEEHESVDAYLKDKKVKIKTENVPDVEMMLAAGAGDEDEDDDDEMQSIDSDDDGQPKKSKPSQRGDNDDSEEDGM